MKGTKRLVGHEPIEDLVPEIEDRKLCYFVVTEWERYPPLDSIHVLLTFG